MTPPPEFQGFGKIARLNREITVTEKIDGTNAQIFIPEEGDGPMLFGSRNRWLTPDDDNFGFCKWGLEHYQELKALGPGRHYGEWWGQKIGRKYGLDHKRFSLFNTARWNDENTPDCCHVVPVLYKGPFSEQEIKRCIADLRAFGSWASPDFMKPEGVVVWHTAAQAYYKVTCEKDEVPKAVAERQAAGEAIAA